MKSLPLLRLAALLAVMFGVQLNAAVPTKPNFIFFLIIFFLIFRIKSKITSVWHS